jgi:uncharacterized protein (DUF924 family)
MTSPSLKPLAVQPQDVVAFWRDAGPQAWFSKSDAFDADFRQRFEAAHWAAASRQLDEWLEDADGALALMILLDQFPRNAFRGTAHMFATDPLAQYFAERAIASGHDLAVDPRLRQFFYLPFEHAESLVTQNRGVSLMEHLDATSSSVSAASRIATPRWAARRPRRNRSSWRPAASRANTCGRAGCGQSRPSRWPVLGCIRL